MNVCVCVGVRTPLWLNGRVHTHICTHIHIRCFLLFLCIVFFLRWVSLWACRSMFQLDCLDSKPLTLPPPRPHLHHASYNRCWGYRWTHPHTRLVFCFVLFLVNSGGLITGFHACAVSILTHWAISPALLWFLTWLTVVLCGHFMVSRLCITHRLFPLRDYRQEGESYILFLCFYFHI